MIKNVVFFAAFLSLVLSGSSGWSQSDLMSRVLACAQSADIDISANFQGSLESIFGDGESVDGKASWESQSEFLKLFPEDERLEAYQLYTECLKDGVTSGGNIVYACYPTGEQPKIWINNEEIDISSYPEMRPIIEGLAGALGEIFITIDGVPLMLSANGEYFDASRKSARQRAQDRRDFAESGFRAPYYMLLDYTNMDFSNLPIEWGGASLSRLDPDGQMVSITVLSHSLNVEVYAWMYANNTQGNAIEMHVSVRAAQCQRA